MQRGLIETRLLSELGLIDLFSVMIVGVLIHTNGQ